MQVLKQFIRNFLDWWSQRSRSTRSLPPYIWVALLNYLRRGTRQAAALAYYAVFSIFPLSLLLAVAIGSIIGPAAAQEQISNAMQLFLPPEAVDIFKDVAQALGGFGSFGIIAVIALVWSALGLFTNITWALDTIFQVPSLRSMWRQRVLAFGMTITFVILIGTSFITSGVLRLVSAFLINQPSIWISIAIWFLPLGLNVVIFALLFRYVPSRHVHWDAIWPAAMTGALLLELSKVFFEWYLTNLADYTVVYGGLAAGIILLFWVYLIMSIFLFSAELCAQLNLWFRDQREQRQHRSVQISFQGGQIHVEVPSEKSPPNYLP